MADSHGYIVCNIHRMWIRNRCSLRHWWKHHTSVLCSSEKCGALRNNCDVLLVDCTYKSSKTRFPLLHVVGNTMRYSTFSEAFVFMKTRITTRTSLPSTLSEDCYKIIIFLKYSSSIVSLILWTLYKAYFLGHPYYYTARNWNTYARFYQLLVEPTHFRAWYYHQWRS